MKSIKRSILVLFFIFSTSDSLFASEVKNYTSRQEGNKIIFGFDVFGEKVTTYISIEIIIDGIRFKEQDLHLSGDLGEIDISTNNEIVWDVKRDFPERFQGKFDWEIISSQSRTEVSNEVSIKKNRKKKKHNRQRGMGIGMDFQKKGLSYGGFIDYNLNPKNQIHLQAFYGFLSGSRSNFSTTGSQRTIDSVLVGETTTYSTFLSYRRFFSDKYGFYFGLGGGLEKSEMPVQIIPYDTSSAQLKPGQLHILQRSGIFAKGELGWQGKSNFYFNIVISPRIFSYRISGDKEASTNDYGAFQSKVNELWQDHNTQDHSLFIGMGLFF